MKIQNDDNGQHHDISDSQNDLPMDSDLVPANTQPMPLFILANLRAGDIPAEVVMRFAVAALGACPAQRGAPQAVD
jgi:hypothetical protein